MSDNDFSEERLLARRNFLGVILGTAAAIFSPGDSQVQNHKQPKLNPDKKTVIMTPEATEPQAFTSNPHSRNVIVSLFNPLDDYSLRVSAAASVVKNDAHFLQVIDLPDSHDITEPAGLNDSAAVNQMVSGIEQHIRTINPHLRTQYYKEPLLDTIVITGHGTTNSLSINDPEGLQDDPKYSQLNDEYYLWNTLSTFDILDTLQQMKKRLGNDKPLCKEMIFVSCDIFAKLTEEDIKKYQAAAKELGCDISGAYTLEFISATNVDGCMATFHSDGTVTPSSHSNIKAYEKDYQTNGIWHPSRISTGKWYMA